MLIGTTMIDRVFVHALNTVKRIPRTGTARPPTAERLKLYGLYKQSMGMSCQHCAWERQRGQEKGKLISYRRRC